MGMNVFRFVAFVVSLIGSLDIAFGHYPVHAQSREKSAKKPDADSPEVHEFWNSMDQVTKRGQDLFAYDQAAWHGTDAINNLHPDKKGLSHFLCIHEPKGWVVTFPAWNATGDKLLIRYQATESDKPNQYQARQFAPPIEAPAEMAAMEYALDLAWADFGKPSRQYNDAVLPAPNGFFVYLYPAQTVWHVYPIGGDVRYTISTDGKRILEKHQMHEYVLDLDFREGAEAGFHTHFLSGVPEDTDVFLVLTRTEHVPEYIIITPEKLWMVMTSGVIGVPIACAQPDDYLCKKKSFIKEIYEKSQEPLPNQQPTK
jgi:hypothetical protein